MRDEFTFEIKDSKDNTYSYNMVPVPGKDGIKMHFQISQNVIASFSGIAVGSLTGIKSLDFDEVWELSRVLFKDALVNGDPIGNIDNYEPWQDDTSQFYKCFWKAVRGNYPDFFSSIPDAVKGFIQKAKETRSDLTDVIVRLLSGNENSTE